MFELTSVLFYVAMRWRKSKDPAFPLNVLMCDEMVLLMVVLFRCQKTVTTHRWLREYSQ